MQDRDRAALVACLLEVLGEGNGEGADEASRIWPASGHPHYDGWGWNPRGPSAYRLAGRVKLHKGRRVGRY